MVPISLYIKQNYLNNDYLNNDRISCGIEKRNYNLSHIHKITSNYIRNFEDIQYKIKNSIYTLYEIFKFTNNNIPVNRKILVEGVKLSNYKIDNYYIKKLLLLKNDVNNIVKNMDYELIKMIKIPVPIGLKTNLYDVVYDLSFGIEVLNKNLYQVLHDYKMFVSALISDAAFRNTITPIYFKSNLDKPDKFYNIIRDIITKNIDENSYIEYKNFKDVHISLSLFGKTYMKYIEQDEFININNLKEILLKTDDLAVLISRVVKIMNDEHSKYKISNNIFKTLTNTTGDIANIITYSSSLMLLSDYIGNSLIETINIVKKIK